MFVTFVMLVLVRVPVTVTDLSTSRIVSVGSLVDSTSCVDPRRSMSLMCVVRLSGGDSSVLTLWDLLWQHES